MKILSTNSSRRVAALVLAAAVAFPWAGAAHVAAQRAHDIATEVDGPNILVNGGFERGADPGVQLALTSGTTFLTGWTVANPGFALYYVGTAWQAEEGTRSLELANPPPGNLKYAGGVSQTFPTTAGQKYLLTFYQAGNPSYKQPMTIEAQVAGLTSTYTYQADANGSPQQMEWVRRAITFTAKAASTTVAFYAYQTCCNVGLGLDNVQVHALASSGTLLPGAGTAVITGTVTLQLAAPTVTSGSQQTVQGAAGKNAAVALVVDYPDGTQLVAALKAGADGHYSHTWTVPASTHGLVQVLVDSAGKTARRTFTLR
jgi:choice-of-anchor C domain-containing protein